MNHDERNMDHSMSYPDVGVMGSLRGLSASQGNLNSHDTSMTGMLEDGMFEDFDQMGTSFDINGFDGEHGQAGYVLNDGMHSSSAGENAESSKPMSADNLVSGAGAGPLPTGFGAQSTLANGSTLTEFTKRRNWSQRVVEELKDFLHILTPDGQIVYSSPSGEELTGYTRDELVGKFVVDFIHPDDSGLYVREFNESITSGHPLRLFYRFKKKDETYAIFETHGHPHHASGAPQYGAPINMSGSCRGFFMMARPYPAKNAALLDSFLEHKIENERLRKRIDELRREEAEEADGWQKKQDGVSENQSEETETVASVNAPMNMPGQHVLSMPPPGQSSLKAGLTYQNLADANAGRQADSINDKMARYEGATHIETIEMLTGLRYQDGERSHGISTGDQSPALIRGDAGITIAADKDGRSGDKKKKIKLPDEYVCTDCGTLDSPEWRKGPTGPKTLCNACGLRWAKKEKKTRVPSMAPTPAA